ncbi:DUF1289 domain-containing protein [Sphingomonas sp.]|uniref:DUF1289 domain-containing protein n=1 Tax=Sphingomonas sp. TaxID=28214 RepID=UPI003B00F36A
MIPSPCTGVCALDPSSGRCRGCARTLDEIARWPSADDEGKRIILAQVAARRLASSSSRRFVGESPAMAEHEPVPPGAGPRG